ncbi:molybdopterin-dependent oxidoreductase, partial [Chloroflexota bacterium]
MKRVGERGDGKWERISWDEALDKIASEIVMIRDTDGPMAILTFPGLGDVHYLHRSPMAMSRLAEMIGLIGFGVADHKWPFQYSWNITSYAQGVAASQYTYGSFHTCNTRDDLVNSRFIILWGWDPAWTVAGPNTCWYIAKAREAGARIVAVDPKHTDTAATFADRWIPIRPGTDAAMLIAMAYVMIDEDLYDKKFIDTHTVGFDKYKEYVLGVEDGVPKTPSWAEKITGVPAADIVELAREYATIKPAALMAGIGPGRTAYGEQYHRAAITLACMTGNVGIHGGDAAGRAWESVWPGIQYPVKPIDDALAKGLLGPTPKTAAKADFKMPDPTVHQPPLHGNLIPELIKMGMFKMIFTNGGSLFTQFADANRAVEGVKTVEFIVVMEQFMTPLAKVADLLLPCTTFFERNDITYGVGAPFIGKINKVIEPVGECRNFIDVADELAKRLGAEGYLSATEDELIKDFATRNNVPDYEELKRTGVYRYEQSKPEVVFKAQIEDPANNPFPTPSGKIEIYSQEIADWELPNFPPIPKYIETWESRDDPLAEKYPLQLVSTHFKRRQLSKLDTIPWLREVQRQAVTISSADAKARSISDGEVVRVFNDRGEVIIPAKVTERIMPGVVEVPHGSWYNPNRGGTNLNESANNLTAVPNSPSGGMCYNSCLVQVEKIQSE